MKKLLTYCSALILLLFSLQILAADPPPLALMKSVSNRTLNALQKNQSRLKNRQVIYNIVNGIIVPHFDLTAVSRSVVGKQYWYQASPQQRQSFTNAFKYYVIDMYASALSSYSNEKIIFAPMRSFNPQQSRVRIYSKVQRGGTPPVSLNYRLVRYGNNWKIYDFSVDGISMVQSYRAQFAPILRQGGLPELTNKLNARR